MSMVSAMTDQRRNRLFFLMAPYTIPRMAERKTPATIPNKPCMATPSNTRMPMVIRMLFFMSIQVK